jgi:uncharacterized OB-fold protein
VSIMNGIQTSVCRSCGRALYPHRSRCPACGGTDLDIRAFEGAARLVTFTHVHMLSLAYTDLYITLGIVEFADGCRALGRLDVDQPTIGMKLKAGVGVVRSDGIKETQGLRFTKA